MLKLKENFKKHYHPTGLIYIDESMNFVDELYYIPTVHERRATDNGIKIKKKNNLVLINYNVALIKLFSLTCKYVI